MPLLVPRRQASPFQPSRTSTTPTPVHLLMAAAQMQSEGRLGDPPDDTPAAKLASIPPTSTTPLRT